MDNELLDRISLHPPESPIHLTLLVGLVAAIWLVARHRAGAPFAAVAALLGLVCYLFLEPHPYIPTALLLALLLSPRPQLDPDERRRALLFLRELLILGGGFILYEIGRMHTVGSYDDALRNALRLIRFQDALGLPREAPLQEWVLQSETAMRILNRTYSFAFLSTVVGTLLWLYLNDSRHYRLFRAGLASASALTILTIWQFPVAPPRLVPASGMLDTHVLEGREHGFLNPYAAVPSNHVGWMVLTGVVLALSIGGRRGALIGAIPALTMSFTVVATGNHFWLDGVVGAAYALLPLAVVGLAAAWRRREVIVRAVRTRNRTTLRRIGEHWHAQPEWLGWLPARTGSLALAILLAYLLIGQIVRPGFTDYWGYQVAQVSGTLVVVLIGERRRNGVPLFTWETRAIVVGTTWADCLGTAGHLYDRFATYDKYTHFAGTAAVTALCAEMIALLVMRGKLNWTLSVQVMVAVAFGVFCGIVWEIYEYLGDEVFDTGRVQGVIDTRLDIVSDTAGAVVAALLVARRQAKTMSNAPMTTGELAGGD